MTANFLRQIGYMVPWKARPSDMAKRILSVIFVMTSSLTAFAFDVRCSLGATCIETQGTRITPDKVIAMSGACDDFIRNDIGILALKLSQQEILNRTKGKPMHPLNVAVWAFEQLRNSPLIFERKSEMESTNYYGECQDFCVQGG